MLITGSITSLPNFILHHKAFKESSWLAFRGCRPTFDHFKTFIVGKLCFCYVFPQYFYIGWHCCDQVYFPLKSLLHRLSLRNSWCILDKVLLAHLTISRLQASTNIWTQVLECDTHPDTILCSRTSVVNA